MTERETHRSDDEEPSDWLDSWAVPSARPGFREEVRAAFLSGAASSSGPGAGSEGDLADLAKLEQQLAPYLDALDGPAPEAGFADRLRGEFVRGPGHARRPAHPPRPASRLSLRWRLLAGGLVAAAASWVLFLRPTGGDTAGTAGVENASRGGGPVAVAEPALRLVPDSYTSAAALSVDGTSLGELGADEIDARLRAARTVSTGDTSVRLRFDDYFVVELAPHSGLEWKAAAPRSAGADTPGARDFVLETVRGALRVATGPAFEGSSMVVGAAYMDVEVVGTVFGIDVYEGLATCLCCCEGAVEVRPRIPGRPKHVVEAGETRIVGPDLGRDEELPAEHADPLERLALFWQ